MKPIEIREFNPAELADKIDEKAEELANLKFQLALFQLENTSKVKAAKREYARLLTIMAEHQRGVRPLSGVPEPVKEAN